MSGVFQREVPGKEQSTVSHRDQYGIPGVGIVVVEVGGCDREGRQDHLGDHGLETEHEGQDRKQVDVFERIIEKGFSTMAAGVGAKRYCAQG